MEQTPCGVSLVVWVVHCVGYESFLYARRQRVLGGEWTEDCWDARALLHLESLVTGIALNIEASSMSSLECNEARAGALVWGSTCIQRHRMKGGSGTAGLFECYRLMLVCVLSSTIQNVSFCPSP